ncbi:MAG: hypothetical protein OXH20_13570 [bacterium]|nr:hypothetical protein [bacterium]MXZ30150.1 hypothetical protein [Acidimicrobiia bacterium]MYB25382.1 hypothetical protein [Acidimicrobiia bacterium]MYJ14128.1 hypothetical protein [Acidimicrobiia bacterium]
MIRDFSLNLDALRGFLHLVSVCVWVGGQIVVAGLIPLLRRIDRTAAPTPDGEQSVTQKAAHRFGRIAWPFFALAIITGLWSLGEVVSNDEWATSTGAWKTLFFVKIALVAASGVGAWLHGRAQRAPERALFASVASLTALAALLIAASFQSLPA